MQGCCTAKSFLVDNLDRNHLHNLLKCSLHTELAEYSGPSRQIFGRQHCYSVGHIPMRCRFFCFTKSRLVLGLDGLTSLVGPGTETTCKKCVGDIKKVENKEDVRLKLLTRKIWLYLTAV